MKEQLYTIHLNDAVAADDECPFCFIERKVTQDLLDMYSNFKPKFVKHFAHIRAAMVEGLNQFHAETLSGEFPTSEYCFNKQVEIPPLDD